MIIFRKKWLLLLIVALLSSFPYLASLENGFVDFDDPSLLYANPLVKNFDFIRTFTTKNAEDYLPLVTTSFALEHYFFGLDPFYYHLTNLILHMLNSTLVFILLSTVFPQYTAVAFLSALIFGVHPLHVESVAWVSQRKDMLCTSFSLLSILYFFKSGTKKPIFICLSFAFFMLALFSKFMAVTVPILIVLIGLYNKERVKTLLVKTIPFFILMIIFTVIHLNLHNSPEQTKSAQLLSGDGFANAINSLAFYAGKTIYPVGLSAFYEKNVAAASVLDFSIFIALIVLTVVTGRQHKALRGPILLLSCFYLVSIAPVLQLIPFGNKFIFADRFMYLPSVGLFTLVLLTSSAWITNHRAKIMAAIGSCAVVIWLAYASFQQTLTWKNSMTLWQNVLNNYPDSSVANNNLASEYFKLNDIPRAAELFEKAIRLDPNFAEPLYGLGTLLTNLKNYGLAKELIEKAIALNPADRTAHYNYGVWAETQSMWQQARASYQKSVQLDPYFPNAYVNLSSVNYRLGKMSEAKENLSMLLKFDRTIPAAYNNLGLIQLAENDAPAAIISFEMALSLSTRFLPAYESLAKAYLLNQEPDKAQETMRTYLKLTGK